MTSEEGGSTPCSTSGWPRGRAAPTGRGQSLLEPSGEALGSSSYLSARPEHDGVEIGWTWLNPSAWRTGANREAKLLLLGFAFEELGCMRVEFKTDARNERSRAALEALPATFEGVFREHMLMPGIGRRDSAYYSIVDSEWPAVRAGLRPENERHPMPRPDDWRVAAIRRAYAALAAEDRDAVRGVGRTRSCIRSASGVRS